MILQLFFFCTFLVLVEGVNTLCLRDAEAATNLAVSNPEDPMTTSSAYKRHLAKHFCSEASAHMTVLELASAHMTVLELGVYHGHTTAVLASMFKKVIAVDLEKDFLKTAAKNLGKLQRNVVFLEMDLLTEGWSFFANNKVEVVVIDANHDYEYVRADAENALRYLPDLQYLVFHGTWLNDVKLAVAELERAGMMSCENIHGTDGKTEGKLCKRLQSTGTAIAPSFSERRFLVYKSPMTTLGMCASGVLRFSGNGRVEAGRLKTGRWNFTSVSLDALVIRLPKLSARPMMLQFNMDRSAFLLTQMKTQKVDWFGLSEQMASRPFHAANGPFEGEFFRHPK